MSKSGLLGMDKFTWCLGLRKNGEMVAFHNKNQVFSSFDFVNLSAIGCLLDIERRTLKFYDVKNDSDIFTFAGIDVKDALYPIFAIYKTDVICSLKCTTGPDLRVPNFLKNL